MTTRRTPNQSAPATKPSNSASSNVMTFPCEQRRRGVIHLGRRKLRHAAMIERTNPQLARTALHLLLEMNGQRKVRLGPHDVRRAEQSNNRPVKGGGEVARPAIGGNQQIGPANARLCQSDRQGG